MFGTMPGKNLDDLDKNSVVAHEKSVPIVMVYTVQVEFMNVLLSKYKHNIHYSNSDMP